MQNFGSFSAGNNSSNTVNFSNSVQHKHLNLADDEDHSFAVSSLKQDVKATTAKGKNHPSFTIILRKQLPVCFDAHLTALSTTLPIGNISGGSAPTSYHLHEREQFVNGSNFDSVNQSENSDQTMKAAEQDASASGDDNSTQSSPLALKKDFILAKAWQVWILDDVAPAGTASSNPIGGNGNDWNVKRQGSPAQTARQFWSIYAGVHDLLEDVNLKNLMIFQDAIEPKWEDPANQGGGRWYFDAPYNGRNENHCGGGGGRRECLLRANYWTNCLETVLSGCLGPASDLIVGLILNFKACKYRVSLWVRSCDDFNQVIQLGTRLRTCLNLRCQLKFELHWSASSGNSTNSVFELN